jgi:hypothetical protein
MRKSASEMPVASIHQDHEENPEFSGTAPYAEALAKSSNHHADRKQRPSQQGEVTGKSASETPGASIHQDHEENPAFSGTAPYAEALAKSPKSIQEDSFEVGLESISQINGSQLDQDTLTEGNESRYDSDDSDGELCGSMGLTGPE